MLFNAACHQPPARTFCPSFTAHDTRLPAFMVGLSAGIVSRTCGGKDEAGGAAKHGEYGRCA